MPSITFGDTTRDASLAGNMVGGDDAYVGREGTAYSPTTFPSFVSNALTAETYRTFFNPNYFVYNTLLKWNTSSLPDNATVTAATLRVWVINKSNADSLNLSADWYSWNGTTADHTATPGTNALAGTAISQISTASDNDFVLSNVNNVSTTGYTYLRLHISQRASDAAPTGDNMVQIATVESNSYPEARLVVTYATGSGDFVGQVHI